MLALFVSDDSCPHENMGLFVEYVRRTVNKEIETEYRPKSFRDNQKYFLILFVNQR